MFADAYGDKHAHDQADTYTEAAPYSPASAAAPIAFVDEKQTHGSIHKSGL